jgi:hypothetical protein
MYDCANVARQKSLTWCSLNMLTSCRREAVSHFSAKVWLKPVAVSGLSESGFSGFKD